MFPSAVQPIAATTLVGQCDGCEEGATALCGACNLCRGRHCTSDGCGYSPHAWQAYPPAEDE